ncbi:hypothetical protein AGDE_16119 [Angomonas deanei]|uniref:Transmembrane protein n=1 Tax=Angomonas deanei TaxID=59799 RepID=A0A7G2CSV3_9TRYP|nr:hypothetical protein AGDE_16119 [Angomonas deanei]CAD2222297.1 hypothetical protein, conserved [Angomonas deanei]|eukprot:EPY17677.1 hypothetical protein AGDE_16119 [Angomonas deanei]
MSTALIVALLAAVTVVRASPGVFDQEKYSQQKCSAGCVAGLMLMAFGVTFIAATLMCCITWPSPETVDRQKKRAAAKKALRERKEAEEEERLKAEAGEEDEADAKGHGHGH